MNVNEKQRVKNDLKILICTTNMGNKEPLMSSIESWIPYDGEINKINTSNSKYPILPLPKSFFQEEPGSPFFQQDDDDDDDDDAFNNNHSDNNTDDEEEEKGFMNSKLSYISNLSGINISESDLSDKSSYFNIYDSIESKGNINIDEKEQSTTTIANNNAQQQTEKEIKKANAFHGSNLPFLPDDSIRDSISYNSIANSIKSNNSSDSYFDMYQSIQPTNNSSIRNSIARSRIKSILEEDSEKENKEQFDIIVIGMQEATFLEGDNLQEDSDGDSDSDNGSDDSRSSSSSSDESSDNDNGDKKKKKKKKGIKRGWKKKKEQLLLSLYAMAADANHCDEKNKDIASKLGGTKVIERMLERRCPSYKKIIHNQRGAMRIIVLIKNDIKNDIEHIDCYAGNTGIGNLLTMGAKLPNKGGIIVNLEIYKTKFSFVSAHLAAHEGLKYYANRCNDMRNIFRQARKGYTENGISTTTNINNDYDNNNKNAYNYDATITNHHIFVFGDLNFRIQLPNKHEHVEKVLSLINKKDWITLSKYDELNIAIKHGDAFTNFKTLPCTFPPTFKVQRLDGFHYKSKRTPSYTDRIVWKSAHGHASNVTPIYYEPCPSFSDSDHKPMRGAFSITTNNNLYHANEKIFKEQMKCHIFISDLSCNTISARCFENSSTSREEKQEEQQQRDKQQEYKFYTAFLTSPIELLQNDTNITKVDKFPMCHKSDKCKGTLDSILWDDNDDNDDNDIHIILTDPSINDNLKQKRQQTCNIINNENNENKVTTATTIEYNDSFLDGSFLYMTLILKDNDIIIGTAAIDLQTINHHKHAQTNAPAAYHAEDDNFSWEDFFSDELQPTITLINTPLRKNGLIQGYISCNIIMIWHYFKDCNTDNLDETVPSRNDSRCVFGERRKKKEKKKWYKR